MGTLAGIRQFLNKFTPPGGSFDPAGAWKQSYIIQLEDYPTPSGWIEIQHSGGELHVESLVIHGNGGQQTTASIQCASDPLASPRSWKLELVMRDPAGQPIAVTRVVQEASVKGDAVEMTYGGRKHALKVPRPFTSNWSLFAAVQRLDAKQTRPTLRARRRSGSAEAEPGVVADRENKTVEAAEGKPLGLTGFQRIGEGVLPYQYWLDDQHRLLFVQMGPRGYLFDPEARGRVSAGSRKGRKG